MTSRRERKMMNWHPRILRSEATAIVLVGCGLLSLQLAAQEQKPAAPKSSSAAKGSQAASAGAKTNPPAAAAHGQELNAADLSAFLHGLIPQQIEKADIAGAVVAVLKDGKVLLE